ncbi:MAG: SLBB domain-containing protein, partial [Chloroflexota bacterium]
MTTILATPAGRPRPILGDAAASVPTDLDAAVAAGAFAGLRSVVGGLGPTGTVATIAASGLRGRGGAGYPAGDKWRAVAGAADPVRYVVANGYEADPAQSTNRVLMETRPFAVVEGVAIAALAVGAREAIIAVRAEYADAVRALEAAAFAAEEAGFLGADVLGSGRDVAVVVRTVQGAYMLGEETVLLGALEGRRGQPEQRPPYPTERGLFGHPTLVHNVATLATVPWIISHGIDAFRAIGDPDAPGTVLVGVSGAVASPGIAEVPTGTTLRELIDLAGGVAAGHTFKAALVGGPTGGLLPAELLDTPYSFEA